MQNISEQEFATKHQWLVVAVVVVVSMICIVAVFACCSAAVIAAGTGAAPLLHPAPMSVKDSAVEISRLIPAEEGGGTLVLVICTQVCSNTAALQQW